MKRRLVLIAVLLAAASLSLVGCNQPWPRPVESRGSSMPETIGPVAPSTPVIARHYVFTLTTKKVLTGQAVRNYPLVPSGKALLGVTVVAANPLGSSVPSLPVPDITTFELTSPDGASQPAAFVSITSTSWRPPPPEEVADVWSGTGATLLRPGEVYNMHPAFVIDPRVKGLRVLYRPFPDASSTIVFDVPERFLH